MKRLSALLLSLAIFASFTLHGFAHDGQAEHPCAVCKVGEAQHVAAAPVSVSIVPQLEAALGLPSEPAWAAVVCFVPSARAPPASA